MINKNKCRDQEIKSYYRSVKRALVCKHTAKSEIMSQFESSVENYIDANSDCTFDDIKAHFGTPKDIAEEYALSSGINYEKNVKFNKSVITVVIVMTVTILICVLTAHFLVIDAKSTPSVEFNPSYSEKSIDQ